MDSEGTLSEMVVRKNVPGLELEVLCALEASLAKISSLKKARRASTPQSSLKTWRKKTVRENAESNSTSPLSSEQHTHQILESSGNFSTKEGWLVSSSSPQETGIQSRSIYLQGSPNQSTTTSSTTTSSTTTSNSSSSNMNRNHSVSFLLKEDEMYEVHKPSKSMSGAEKLLENITYLTNFNRSLTNITTTNNNKSVGRYSLLDENMRSVEEPGHVITELWQLSKEKASLALAGHMNSCQEEETEIDCSQLTRQTRSPEDYKAHLVPVSGVSTGDNSDSGDDTDDLIEDARNFVMIGRNQLVDLEAWHHIDQKRRERRRMRSRGKIEKEAAGNSATTCMGSDGEEDTRPTPMDAREELYLPRRLADLQLGSLVKVLATRGTGILPAVVRFLGSVEGAETVGVELRDRQGDTDGSIANKRYFTCPPGYGLFIPLSRVVLAWRPVA